MVKQQVKVVIIIVYLNALLSCNEGETCAQLKDEVFHLPHDRIFDILLKVAVFQSKEVKEIRIPEDQIRREFVLSAKGVEFLTD